MSLIDSNDDMFFSSYLNSQHIQKQKFSDADLTYGSMQMDVSEQLLEIGEQTLKPRWWWWWWLFLKLLSHMHIFFFICNGHELRKPESRGNVLLEFSLFLDINCFYNLDKS